MQLILYLLLTQFPSGSAISYKDGKLFLVGDDSNTILILTPDYKHMNRIELFQHPEKRIPKKVKPDFEAASFIIANKTEYFAILGSGSDTLRKTFHLIPVVEDTLRVPDANIISTRDFINRVQQLALEEVNFEGFTAFNNKLLISNRGNLKNKTNHLLVTNADFWMHQNDADIQLIPFDIPALNDKFTGVSELHYEKSLDLLLITLSSEATTNAYDDGTIGNSYLGWIKSFSSKINGPSLTPDKIICLTDVHPEFKNQKIEGVCLERIEKDSIILHLISDNDDGASKVFCVKVPFK